MLKKKNKLELSLKKPLINNIALLDCNAFCVQIWLVNNAWCTRCEKPCQKPRAWRAFVTRISKVICVKRRHGSRYLVLSFLKMVWVEQGVCVISAMLAILIARKLQQKKNRRVWVRCWISRREKCGVSHQLCHELRNEDISSFQNFFRLNPEHFLFYFYSHLL